MSGAPLVFRDLIGVPGCWKFLDIKVNFFGGISPDLGANTFRLSDDIFFI